MTNTFFLSKTLFGLAASVYPKGVPQNVADSIRLVARDVELSPGQDEDPMSLVAKVAESLVEVIDNRYIGFGLDYCKKLARETYSQVSGFVELSRKLASLRNEKLPTVFSRLSQAYQDYRKRQREEEMDILRVEKERREQERRWKEREEKEEQKKNRPFDPSVVRMPRSYEPRRGWIKLLPSGGWTDGETADFFSVPPVIQKAIEKLEGREEKTFIIDEEEALEKLYQASTQGKVEVFPLALYGDERWTGGEKKWAPESVVLGNREAGGALMVSIKPYSYFVKLHPGSRFFTSDEYRFVVVKAEDKAIGMIAGELPDYVPDVHYLAILRRALAVAK